MPISYETCLVRVRLSLLRCEMRVVRARLPSTYARTVYMFSPTSPTITHDHQVLNPRQSKCFKDFKYLVLHAVLHDLVHCVAICTHASMGANGHAAFWCMKQGVENELLTVFFVELGKREARLVSSHHPFVRCETHLVRARIPSTCARTVYKFSPTSPTRTHGHQLLNKRQSEGFKD
jgi:hypothetical protein